MMGGQRSARQSTALAMTIRDFDDWENENHEHDPEKFSGIGDDNSEYHDDEPVRSRFTRGQRNRYIDFLKNQFSEDENI